MAQQFSFSSSEKKSPTECSHLVSGKWRSTIAALCVAYPNLRYPDFETPIPGIAGRVALLKFPDEGRPVRKDFEDPLSLRLHLEQATSTHSIRRLFLVEGLDPSFMGLLGQHFDIDPLLIVKQQRTAKWESYHRAGNTPILPSLLEPDQSFHIPYHELHHYPQGLPDKFDWRCADSGRQISSSRMPGTFDRVGIVDHKASFWSQKREDGGWDGWSMIPFLISMNVL